MITYTVEVSDGNVGETSIEAENDPDATDLAIQWVLDQSWPETGCSVLLTLHRDRSLDEACSDCHAEPGVSCGEEPCVIEVGRETIDIEPREEAFDIHASRHVRNGHTHQWETPLPLVGGTKEHPGVLIQGSTTTTTFMCVCGAKKIVTDKETGDTQEDSRSSLRISYPKGLWPWGPLCTYPGKRKKNP